jgi:hypothetical protein
MPHFRMLSSLAQMSNLTFAKRQTRGATCDDGTPDVKVCVRIVIKSNKKCDEE